mgnify:CR=1 FL=1
MALEWLEDKTAQVLERLRSMEPSEVVVVHHDDADGLCSGAIVKAVLERMGLKPKLVCLEKLFPEVVRLLHSGGGKAIFYCDIGSPHADLISRANGGRNLTVILDHHDPRPADDPMVLDLNLEHVGVRGEEEFSGATCCYLFAKAVDEANRSLSYLALVGSCEIPVGYKGINEQVLDEALRDGVVRRVGKKLVITKLGVGVRELFSALQVLGPVGYYSGGPEVGIRAALEGLSGDIKKLVKELEEKRKAVNKRLLARLYKQGLRRSGRIQWFNAGRAYKGMGSKVIGTFCSYLSHVRKLAKPDMFVVGLMEMETAIPGLGELKGRFYKVSVRAPRDLRADIDAGRAPSAVQLLKEATEGFGIAVDGHAYAASCVIPADKVEEFIRRASEASVRGTSATG